MSTSLARWDPFAGLTSMHSQIDDMFNNFFGSDWLGPNPRTPALDVYTQNDDKELVAEVSAPGFTTDDISVRINNGVLEIKGEKHQKDEDKDAKGKRNYMMRESHASFYRSILLPKAADGDAVTARFEDGLLKVTVPMKELPEPKKIAIEAGPSVKK